MKVLKFFTEAEVIKLELELFGSRSERRYDSAKICKMIGHKMFAFYSFATSSVEWCTTHHPQLNTPQAQCLEQKLITK